MTEYERFQEKIRIIDAKGKGEMGFPLEEGQTKKQQEEDLRKLRERLGKKHANAAKSQ